MKRTIPALVATLTALVLSACGAGTSSFSTASRTGTPRAGGTAYFAEQPLSPPDYIFPLVSGAEYTNANVLDFQTLLYRPLYWFGDRAKPTVDYNRSLAGAPVYSNGDRTVTITLKRARWSDGEPVSARDVGFWINLLRANESDWAAYAPGGFPDNVRSWRALSTRTIQLQLKRAYNPTWYTSNELSQITPLPIAWDRTSLRGPAPQAGQNHLPDTSTAGARAVYTFLDGLAKHPSGYASSPIWSVVDGPWRLTQLTANGQATFVPNRSYAGPRPHLSRFVELPFTSESAELLALRSTSAVSVGYVPDSDVPQTGALKRQGYQLVSDQPYGFNYIEPNFNNPAAGPVFRQLYFRQAFQHLIDQEGWIHAFYAGLAKPTYSPVPGAPYADAKASRNPYPFAPAAAVALLKRHGWSVHPGGTSTCAVPGAGAGRCGAGIRRGQKLAFTLLYPNDAAYTDESMADLQSEAAKAGIQLTLKQVSSSVVTATVLPCRAGSSACSWQLGNYGTSWIFSPGHYPSGEEIFQSGALGNVNNYSNPAIDRLIQDSTTAPPAAAQRTLNAYADAVRLELPDFWQPAPGSLVAVTAKLGGYVPNAYDYLSPEEWYFTR